MTTSDVAPSLPEVRRLLRSFDDFPTPGIRFIDISPVLATPAALREVIDALQTRYSVYSIDRICAIEARGFFLGVPLALALGIPFVPLRKPGKLPGETITSSYTKEYGTDSICIQADAVRPGERVVVIDDILATGGTMSCAADLLKKCDANVVELVCLIEISFLKGRERLPSDVPFFALISDV
jgi:adenine phosphoribosyltransferase